MHTPGPWAFYELLTASENDRGWGVYSETERWRIGEVYPLASDATPEAKANAHLIAAAPDLLEACKQLVRVAAANGYDTDPIHGNEYPWVTAAHAAIAKAEGR